MEEERRKEIATSRFEIIAPLVVRHLRPGERAHIIRDLGKRLWKTADGQLVRYSTRTLARWAARYREYGYAGLLPEARTDRGACRRLPEQFLNRAIELRKEDPQRSIKTIIRIMELEGLTQPGQVKLSTLSHALCRAGVSKAQTAASKETFRRREAPYPNALHQIDTQLALKMPDGSGRVRNIYLVSSIDDYSRHVVARLYLADDRPTMSDLLKRSIIIRGKPEILYCDNGSNYKSHLLSDACAYLGIDLRHARPYRPQGKGKIERWFKTVDNGFNREAQSLIDHQRITNMDQLQQFFAAWLNSEYNNRIHSATHEKPCDRLAHINPEHPIQMVDPETLYRAFLWTETRVVTVVGTISLEGNEYQVDPALARRKITVRFDPFDLQHILVEYQGQSYGEATPLELVRDYSRQVKKPDPVDEPKPQDGASERTPFLQMVRTNDDKKRSESAGRMSFAQNSGKKDGEAE
ncbi:MAG: DDE-type integrase/transposase/recombinase [Peptococcaceae bacterium]|jgi:transposase InsO family protein|nr:DDE-type integrase/transposase/recombinase [Peptococcaceae bacterium]